MYRINGVIPGLTKDKIPRRLVIFDTESYQGKVIDEVEYQSLRLGVARFIELSSELEVIKDVYYNFSDGESLAGWLDDLSRKDSRLYIYAHNLKYDLQLSGLVGCLLDLSFEVSSLVIDDPPTFINMRRNRSSLMLVDTFNYWQFSLAKMGEQLGYEKLQMPPWGENDTAWFEYCKRDVDVLTRYLLEFIRFLADNDLAPLGLTLASQAFRSYRKRFMHVDIETHNRAEVLALERSGYSGGRVEAFYLGELRGEKIYKLDVNSMYPYVMSEYQYPTRLVAHTAEIDIEKLAYLVNNYYTLAKVQIDTDKPCFPLKREGKLLFPTGRFETTLHQPELVYAMQRGMIHRCLMVGIYEQANIFKEYVKFFYRMKLDATLEDNPVKRQMSKLFLNSLYGKFGQRGIFSKVVDNPNPGEIGRMKGYSEKLGRSVEVIQLGSKMEIRYTEGESAYSCPVVAGGVTAYARMYLWGLVEQAKAENVFYMDTDSLFTNEQGFFNLIDTLDDERLGALKVEEIASEVTIFGLKDYIFGGSVKHKGLPKKAELVDIDTWQYGQFLGAKTWLNDGMKTGVTITTRQKRRLHTYDKGEVTSTGFVIPFTLIEW